MPDYTDDDVRNAVFSACLGRDPGTYTALNGTVTLVITETGSGIHASYFNGFNTWNFDFLHTDLNQWRLKYA